MLGEEGCAWCGSSGGHPASTKDVRENGAWAALGRGLGQSGAQGWYIEDGEASEVDRRPGLCCLVVSWDLP